MPTHGSRADREERLAAIARTRIQETHDGYCPPPGYITTRQAADRWRVSMRTIRRDKAELRRREAS